MTWGETTILAEDPRKGVGALVADAFGKDGKRLICLDEDRLCYGQALLTDDCLGRTLV